MAEKKYNKNNQLVNFEDDDEASGTGTTGAGIEFQDFLLPSYQPEEKKLTQQESKQLLIQHANKNVENVKQQKRIREYYKDGKENKNKNKHRRGAGYGLGGGQGQGYGHDTKPHPLTQTVHFGNGAEVKVTSIPSEQVAETNNEQRHELDLTLQNQNRLKMDPQTPRLKPPGA